MPTPTAETQRAVRLVGWVALATALIYAAIALPVTEDSFFARYGLSNRSNQSELRYSRSMMFTRQNIEAFDRDAYSGQVIYLVGSSVAREGLDAERIEARLRRKTGLDLHVVKFAFDAGAPIFQWALLDEMDPRPGDILYLPVSVDHFIKNWQDVRNGIDVYIHHLLDADEVMRVHALEPAERMENALASFWPSEFQRSRVMVRIGLETWMRYGLGIDDDEPYLTDDFEGNPFGSNIEAPRYRTNQIKRKLLRVRKGRMRLDDRQINYQGLSLWREEALARGAVPITGFIPMQAGNPPEGLTPDLWPYPPNVVKFFEHMPQHFQPWAPLRQERASHYIDYKHANHLGRRRYSDQLADLLADSIHADGSFTLRYDGGGWAPDPLDPE